ncbi:30S ribosomal protein S19e [Methanospirillum hungatei]|mgnify:FL=1|jgi:small subunit ribosomal protein S19e|uniref:30S ribosomal protein S19e n=1 Tax=Methanospirillum hungatei TaxID=2203 RepID=UPI001B649913|nr:30S ribosomal protein S19e [Methanospirillum hungatei]MBP7034801.1 30S ribosomal protein S19e [Methanospirillum sp.]MBP9009000.1 30S ribosomal protein S19e [Methanospirillum sp.]HOW05509.1 30S ribosomal protein S19e [Methanospirillum hungatei]
MTTVYDVPADKLIAKAAMELKEKAEITAPEWAPFVKTGTHREMPPEDPEWWYTRAAAVLRRVYVDGPVGVERMRSVYGGKKDRGSKPGKSVKGSGSILRKSLQQLEAAGFVAKQKNGRVITPAGASFLDGIAYSVSKENQ